MWVPGNEVEESGLEWPNVTRQGRGGQETHHDWTWTHVHTGEVALPGGAQVQEVGKVKEEGKIREAINGIAEQEQQDLHSRHFSHFYDFIVETPTKHLNREQLD